jgi:hypothetical protein
LGGERGLGVALVMETWPKAKRPLLAGVLGSAADVGFLLAALLGLFAGGLGWRVLLLFGLIPAILAVFIRLRVLVSSVVVVGTWGVFQWIPSWVNSLVGGDAARLKNQRPRINPRK